MRRQLYRLFALVSFLCVAPTAAHGGEQDFGVDPFIQVSERKVAAGGAISRPLGEHLYLNSTLAFSSQLADGSLRALTADEEAWTLPAPRGIRVDVGLFKLRTAKDIEKEEADKQVAWFICTRRCAEVEGAMEAAKQANKEPAPWTVEYKPVCQGGEGKSFDRNLDPQTYCQDGRDYLESQQDPAEAYPLWSVVGGGEVQWAGYRYLLADQEGGALIPRSDNRTSLDVGLGLFRAGEDLIVEVPLVLSRSYKSGPTAQWCTPSGTVQTSDGTEHALETCTEMALGEPAAQSTLKASLQVGTYGTRSFRLSAGPTVEVDIGERSIAEVGLEVPLYVQLLSLPNLGTNTTNAVARISPTFMFSPTQDGEFEREVYVNLSFVVDSPVFVHPLDWHY